jgi:CRISPR system Cascade subunit CasA
MEHLSIRDVLSRPNGIAEIIDPSPLVTVSLHRLLIAILERSLNIVHFQDLRRIWEDGRWDGALIDDYLDRWHERFDLFDERRPFYQSPGFRKGDPITVNKLFNEMSATNNSVLFDHRFDDIKAMMDAASAARGIVATQAFALGGGKSATINLLHAPLVGKATVLLKGQDLFETLSLNLIPMSNFSPLSLTGEASDKQLSADRPIWEADSPDVPGSARPISGYLDLLTWQPRAILLLPRDDGSMTVDSMHMAQGTVAKNDLVFDPMAAYHLSKDYGWRPVGVDIQKEPWRSLTALIQTTEESKGTMTLRSAGALVREGTLPSQALYRLDVIGMCSEKAKIHLWKHARLPLPASYLTNELLVAHLGQAISVAEMIERNLEAGIWELAKQLLYPAPEAKPDKDAVRQMTTSFHAVPRYWSALEIPFYSLIADLNRSVSDDLDGATRVLKGWSRFAARCADDALNEQIEAVDDGARGLKAAVMARQHYSLAIGGTLKEIGRMYGE